jgi:hypothetical protein
MRVALFQMRAVAGDVDANLLHPDHLRIPLIDPPMRSG